MVELSPHLPILLAVLACTGCFRIQLVRKAMRERGLPALRRERGKLSASRGNVGNTASRQEPRIKLDTARKQERGERRHNLIALLDLLRK